MTTSPKLPLTVLEGSGLPTEEQLAAFYPPLYTWDDLRTFINVGDLALLKRNKRLYERYLVWTRDVKEKYGSMPNYVQSYRIQWGMPDKLSLLRSDPASPLVAKLVTLADDNIKRDWFTADISPKMIYIMKNDWPLPLPRNIEHSLVWTKLPIVHPAVVDSRIAARVHQDGLWGFTANVTPPPPASRITECLPVLAEWGVTEDMIIQSPPPTEEEARLLTRACAEVDRFVRNNWDESIWETAWIVNPPRIQSIPELAHIHVFARRKISA